MKELNRNGQGCCGGVGKYCDVIERLDECMYMDKSGPGSNTESSKGLCWFRAVNNFFYHCTGN